MLNNSRCPEKVYPPSPAWRKSFGRMTGEMKEREREKLLSGFKICFC